MGKLVGCDLGVRGVADLFVCSSPPLSLACGGCDLSRRTLVERRAFSCRYSTGLATE